MFDDGLSATVSEAELIPLPQEPSTELHSQLGNLEIQGYNIFRSRESLLYASASMLREGRSLRALLSSRVDLRPHQLTLRLFVIKRLSLNFKYYGESLKL